MQHIQPHINPLRNRSFLSQSTHIGADYFAAQLDSVSDSEQARALVRMSRASCVFFFLVHIGEHRVMNAESAEVRWAKYERVAIESSTFGIEHDW